MARAYVIHIMDAEFRIFGNKTEVADLLLMLSRNTQDAMKYRGHISDEKRSAGLQIADYWESEDCHDMARISLDADAEALRIAPDYCNNK